LPDVSLPTRILLALIFLLFLPGVYVTVADLTPAPHQEDFGAYYLAAKALVNGESPFDKDAASRLAAASGVEQHSPYIYPPLLAVVLRPLAALPYRAASAIWFVLSAAALLAALTLLRQVVQLPWRSYRWVCAATFFLPPVHHTLQHGQITNFLLLMIVAAALDRPGGSAWAGVAAALKIFPATLSVVYALSGRFARMAVMAASAAALTLAGALAEPAATADFVRRVGPELALERRLAPNNQSLDAVMSRWFEAQWFVEPLINAPAAGRFVSRLAAAAVVGLTLWALVVIRREDDVSVQLERFSLVLAATLIVSPIVWDHYYVLMLLPVATLYRGSRDQTIRLLLLVGVAFLFSHRYWPIMFAFKNPVFMSLGLAGVVVLWIALLKLVSYDRVCAAKRLPSVTRPSAI
jgi:hypothetical protein